jgi:hypothetical protein
MSIKYAYLVGIVYDNEFLNSAFMYQTELQTQKIEINSPENIRKWCTLFNCKEVDLRIAISVTGNSLKAVHDYLIITRNKN